MVDVGMRDDDEIERPNVEGKRGPVLVVGVVSALEHAAVDQEMCARGRRRENTSR